MRVRKEVIVKVFADVPIGPSINIENWLDKSYVLKIKANGDERECELEANRHVETGKLFPKDAEYDRMIIEIWPKENESCINRPRLLG